MESISRYDRQRRFGPIGFQGQERIQAAKVLVIGVGALGSTVAELLARAGVGSLRIVDRDLVEQTNLQRQSLYTESDADAGLAKVQAACEQLRRINSEIHVEPIAADVNWRNLSTFADDVDLIIDGSDNFEIRFLLNDYCLSTSKPWVHGGCVGGGGQVFTFVPGATICFRCLVPELPDRGTVATCETAGVLGPATHLIASLQAAEAIRWIVEGAQTIRHHLMAVDLWTGRWHRIDTTPLRRQNCSACKLGEYPFLHGDSATVEPEVLCGRKAVQIGTGGGEEIDLPHQASVWAGFGKVEQTRFFVRLTFTDSRSITLFRDGRAVIFGTEDKGEARSLYARFVGN